MAKIVVMFLLLMLVIAMIGNLVVKLFGGGTPAPQARARNPDAKGQTLAKCGHCGRVVVGTAPCVCGKG